MKRSRKYSTRYIVSCRFHDGTMKYLEGHGTKDGETCCVFTSDLEMAVSSSSAETLNIGWPYLLSCHARNHHDLRDACIHPANEKPTFKP